MFVRAHGGNLQDASQVAPVASVKSLQHIILDEVIYSIDLNAGICPYN